MDFADLRRPPVGVGGYPATATANQSGITVTVVAAGIVSTVNVVAGLSVKYGDVVIVTRHGSSRWVTAVIQSGGALPDGANTDPAGTGSDPSPAPKPVTRTGTLTCPAVSTATWRDGHWRTDLAGAIDSADTYQGKWYTSGYGDSSGFAFYGTKPQSIKGATVTQVTLHAQRLSGGDFSSRAPTLRLVTEKTRPGSYPTLNETTAGPSLGIGASTSSFALPTSWGQSLVDGTRGGIGMTSGSDSPYIHWAGRYSWSAAWTLVISWRRTS